MLSILTPQEIEEVLRNNILGRIGCRDDDEIYVVPVTYLYDGNAVICHSLDGRKIEMMRSHPRVCFEVEEIVDYQNWKCVIAQGDFEELTDADTIAHASKRLEAIALMKKASLTSLPPAEETGLSHVSYPVSVYYMIVFSKISGRIEKDLG